MSRSLIFAILAFSLIMVINVAVFGTLLFQDLSETMVHERLMSRLSEAQALIEMEKSNRAQWGKNRQSNMENLVTRLKRLGYFKAIAFYDHKGNVTYREYFKIVSENERRADLVTEKPQLMPIMLGTQPDGGRVALEYDRETLEREIRSLRQDLNQKLWTAVVASLLLMSIGLVYVIYMYRRNQRLQEEARKADRLAYVGTLASGLAHEIRNPLNSMNMNVQLIQEELEERGFYDDEDLRDMFEGTRKEILRLEKLVSSFLAYARPTNLKFTPTDMNRLLETILNFLAPEIEKAGVRIKAEWSENLPMVPADEAHLRQALLNVIQNGIQVTNAQDTLLIKTRLAGGDKVLVEIKDQGPGIAEQEMENIFRVFYSTKRGGTGLGLPIAQRIAELHQGGIKIESEVGKGSTFTFILPSQTNGNNGQSKPK